MSSLLGKRINGKLVTKDTPNEVWESEFNCPNMDLTSLEGCPSTVKKYFDCGVNNLTSLEGCRSEVGDYFDCEHNRLTSLQNIHLHLKKMKGYFWGRGNPIKSHVLGVLLIEGCDGIMIDNRHVQKIINKYLTGSRDIFDCQFELIEAGFEEYAQL